MGRPDQGNKAQTPVGYSHGTGVSTGGLATAVLGVVARDTPWVHGVVWGLRCYGGLLECYTGLRGRRRNDDLCVEGYDGEVVRWTVLRTSWRRRGSLGGALTGGTRSSRWRCTGVFGVYAAVLGSVRWGYAAVLGNRTVGEQRGCMAVLGCPPDPSNNSGGTWGHPLAPLTN